MNQLTLGALTDAAPEGRSNQRALAKQRTREKIVAAAKHLFSERGYEGQGHWLLFLFEVKPRLKATPPPHREGNFRFFARSELASLKMPQTDLEQIWPLFWRHRGGFFAAACHCHPDGRNEWTLEESHEGRMK